MAQAHKCDVCGVYKDGAPAYRVCNANGDFILYIDEKCGEKLFGKLVKKSDGKEVK